MRQNVYCPDLALLVTNFPTPLPLDVSKLQQSLPHPPSTEAKFVLLITSEKNLNFALGELATPR